MKSLHAASMVAAVAAAAVFFAGCGGGKLPEESQDQSAGAQTGQMPEGHPPVNGQGGPMAGSMLGDSGPTDDNALPLKLTGLSSVEELKRDLGQAKNDEVKTLFEDAYRKTFTADGTKRDYQGAVEDLKKVLEIQPEFAPAYRTLGYAEFNIGFNVDAAMKDYQKAVDLDPDYGEAQYALAFMYAMTDRDKGAEHFKKAMELGVPDERNLGQKFYPGVKTGD